MNVKIDTKEKFVVIAPTEPHFTAIMTEELRSMLIPYLQKDIPHIVLNLSAVTSMDDQSCGILTDLQNSFYQDDCSFVICELQPALEAQMDRLGMLEILNVTPTETEAWDIVQMEEIERELLREDD